jgi:hypothetical protein
VALLDVAKPILFTVLLTGSGTVCFCIIGGATFATRSWFSSGKLETSGKLSFKS